MNPLFKLWIRQLCIVMVAHEDAESDQALELLKIWAESEGIKWKDFCPHTYIDDLIGVPLLVEYTADQWRKKSMPDINARRVALRLFYNDQVPEVTDEELSSSVITIRYEIYGGTSVVDVIKWKSDAYFIVSRQVTPVKPMEYILIDVHIAGDPTPAEA